jgi:hypothetical protein
MSSGIIRASRIEKPHRAHSTFREIREPGDPSPDYKAGDIENLYHTFPD